MEQSDLITDLRTQQYSILLDLEHLVAALVLLYVEGGTAKKKPPNRPAGD